ncbi:MAG: hypothetical protein DME00_28680 [Candidatus Rokuibacteriota bacterium]|nr:MAG: hypothetical protein DME00_28680 [Candidatus Rokubacteria bacterium]
MPFWVQMLLSLAAFALLLALVAAVWALRGVAQRAEAVLAIVEQELRPLIGQALALTEDVRGLTREAGRELERVVAVTDRVEDVATGLGRIVMTLGSLTRAGQIVGVAAGLKKGIDVFVHRLRHQGDHHEQ